MEWLKNKKNLPIIVALTVVLFVAAGGAIAWELGAFSGSSTASSAPLAPSGPPGSIPSGSLPPSGMPPRGPGGPPGSMPPGIPRGVAISRPLTAVPITVVKKPTNVNPAVGPDPFKIPDGARKLALRNALLAGPKLPLRQAIGPLNLFQIHPPVPPAPPVVVDPNIDVRNTVTADSSSRLRLSGIINGTDGINAIIEVDGQSQSVKPGDTLSTGERVTNIQANSVTLRTAGGAALNLQLSAGTPDQGNTQGNNFNGQAPFQPGFPQQGQNN